MPDAFGVDREAVSKGTVKTILFGAQKIKQPRLPVPPKVSPVTGQPIKFNPRTTTAPQKAFWGRGANKRYAKYQSRRQKRMSQNTPFFPKPAATGPAGPPKKWYQKRSNQLLMGGGAAAFGTAGYMGYKKGKQ